MSINYPTSLDSFTNPAGTDLLENSNPALDHDAQHSNANDAIEALEAKVGADGSAVTTSHDYKLNEITSSDKAVGKTATQTLTNKTLTSPAINVGSDATGDMYYRNAGGAFTRLPAGTDTQIIIYQGGVPTVQNNPAGSDASTTVKGVVEEATQAEVEARTATGGTGARLAITTSNLTTVRTHDYAADASGTDAYAITITPAPTAYTTGDRFTFKAGTANTGTCTLNVNALGAKTIKLGTSNLYTGQILANQIVEVVYDGTDMQLVSMSPLSTNTTIIEAVASGNTRSTNAASVGYNQSTTVYTKMKETLYNDMPGTVNVTYTTGWTGGGIWTNRTRVYINGVAAGTERNDLSNTYTESFTLATGDLVQIYAYIPSYSSGSFTQSISNLILAYDKQLKQTFITNTSNS